MRIISKIFIILSIIFTSCSTQFVLKESYLPFEIKNDYLLIHSLKGNEIKIKEPLKDSIITILKKNNLLLSDSLWCIILYDENNKDPYDSLPDTLVESLNKQYKSYLVKTEPHYTLFFRNSDTDKQLAVDILKDSRFSIDENLIHVVPEIFWDVIISINKEKNQIIEIR